METNVLYREQAIAHEGFPPEGEMVWEIVLPLATLVGLALAARLAVVG